MKPSEAISQLESLNKEVSIYSEAIDMAISALKKQEEKEPVVHFKNGFYYATKKRR